MRRTKQSFTISTAQLAGDSNGSQVFPTNTFSSPCTSTTCLFGNPNSSATMTTSANTYTLASPTTLSNLSVTLSRSASSASSSSTLTVAVMSGSTVALSCQITSGNTSCTSTGSAPVTGAITIRTTRANSSLPNRTISATWTIDETPTVSTATKLVYLQQPTDTQAGSTITPAVTVAVEDTNNNIVTTGTGSSATIGIALTGAGTLGGTTSKQAVGGIATFNDLSVSASGAGDVLHATSTGLTAADSTGFDVIGTPTQLAFTAQPSNAPTGVSISPAVQVAVEDASGNVVTGDNATQITVAIGANPGSGTLSGTLTRTVFGGVATFSDLSINAVGTGYTLTAASSPSYTGDTSGTFAVASVFQGNSAGTSVFPGSSNSSACPAGTCLYGAANASLAMTSVKTNGDFVPPAVTITTSSTFTVSQPVPAGDTLTFTVMKDDSGTNVTCTIQAGGTSCSPIHSINFNGTTDTLNISTAMTGPQPSATITGSWTLSHSP